MDGVHPLRCVEWRWCVLLLSCAVAWARALLIPLQCWRVLLSCHTVFLAGCVVWCECVSVVFVWWGILCLLPPLVVVEGGAIVDGGAA